MTTGGENREPLTDLSEFPRWWRRLFPEIELLADNPLYAAFEVRRAQLRRRPRREVPGWVLALGAFLFVANLAVLLLFGWKVAVVCVGCVLIVGVCVGVWIALHAEPLTSVPARFSNILAPKGIQSDYYLDLWLAPIASREYLMAIASRAYRSSAIAATSFATLLLLFPLYLELKLGDHVSFILSVLAFVPIAPIAFPMWFRMNAFAIMGGFQKRFIEQLGKLTGNSKIITRREAAHQLKWGAIQIASCIFICVAILFLMKLISGLDFDGRTIWEAMVDVPGETWRRVGWIALLLSELIFCWNFWLALRQSHKDFMERLDAESVWFDRLRALMARALSGDDIGGEEFKAEVFDSNYPAFREYNKACRERIRQRRLVRRIVSFLGRLFAK